MKVTVWHHCEVVQTLEYPDADGPDVEIDPWANLVRISSDLIAVRPYRVSKYTHGLMPAREGDR